MDLFRWDRVMAAWAGLLGASLLYAQFTFPPRIHGDMEATLTVEVGRQTAERGRGEVTLTLTVRGPLTLDVEEPRLSDSATVWQEERSPSTRRIEGRYAIWSQVIHLKQVQPGREPVPDVTVRFRHRADTDWIEENWVGILRNVRDAPEGPPLAEERPSQRHWGAALVLAAIGVLILLAWMRKRRRGRREASLPADQWALREIERIEKTLMPPQGEAETFHTQIAFVVRRYLAERFGLHALQQTTAEVFEAMRQLPYLSAEVQALWIELFQRCDLAKFAHAGASPEECQRTADLARELVQRTTSFPSTSPQRPPGT